MSGLRTPGEAVPDVFVPVAPWRPQENTRAEASSAGFVRSWLLSHFPDHPGGTAVVSAPVGL